MTRKVTKSESELIERLKAIAEELGIEMSEIENPDFSEESRYVEWGYYVNEPLQSLWSLLSLEAKLIAAIDAARFQEKDNAMAW